MEHGPLFYLVSWVMALAFSVGFLGLSMWVPYLREDYHRSESGRDQIISRFYRIGGGIVIGIFLLLLLGDTRLVRDAPFVTLWIGALAILLFSLADDFSPVTWPWHLALQGCLGLLVFSSGMRLDIASYLNHSGETLSPLFAVIGVIVWVVLIMNAINWSDGTDGLMPGIAFLSFGTLFLLALRPEVNQPTIAILTVSLAGLALGLLLFNWYPARILAGTGGAYFFGFTLAVLALYAGMKVATLLLVLALPVFDALIVVFRRLMLGRSPFLPDQGHLHHLLLARGWGPATIASVYLLVTGLLALLALSLEGGSKAVVFLIAGILIALITLVLHASLRPAMSDD